MTWEEYVPLAVRTESPVDNFLEAVTGLKLPCTGGQRRLIRSVHAVVGMVTELGELGETATVHLKEELGDLAWYMAIYADAWALDVVVPDDQWDYNRSYYYRLTGYIPQLMDVYKRALFYGKEVEDRHEQLAKQIWAEWGRWVENAGFTISDVLETNINKLKIRYPDRFDQARAYDRDLDAEAKFL